MQKHYWHSIKRTTPQRRSLLKHKQTNRRSKSAGRKRNRNNRRLYKTICYRTIQRHKPARTTDIRHRTSPTFQIQARRPLQLAHRLVSKQQQKTQAINDHSTIRKLRLRRRRRRNIRRIRTQTYMPDNRPRNNIPILVTPSSTAADIGDTMGNGRLGNRKTIQMIMKRNYVWKCPDCQATQIVHIRATEVTCGNKTVHSTRQVPMIQSGGGKTSTPKASKVPKLDRPNLKRRLNNASLGVSPTPK